MARNKFYIAKEFNIQPSEIDRMIFFEYEYLLEDIKAYQKKQEEEEKKRKKEQDSYKMPNPNQYMSSLPKVSIPKL